MDAQQMLGVLLNITEQQSQTTEKLLAALKGQIDVLNVATQTAQKAASTVGQSAATVEQAARNASPAIQKATGEAVGVAVRDSLTGASEMAVAALDTASKPVIDSLAGVARAAGEAEGKLSGAVASFHWKWALMAGGLSVCSVAGVLIGVWSLVWWERHQVESLSEQRQALAADVAQLQANVAELEKKGGRIRLDKCGPDNRLCVEIARDQGGGGPVPYAGAWQSSDKQRQFVIPRGY
jgi:hypothetical protein